MLTQEEKKMLLDVLNAVQLQGTRETIGRTLEKLNALARKIEAMPVEKVAPAENGKVKAWTKVK